jgi:hypothetical protein
MCQAKFIFVHTEPLELLLYARAYINLSSVLNATQLMKIKIKTIKHNETHFILCIYFGSWVISETFNKNTFQSNAQKLTGLNPNIHYKL